MFRLEYNDFESDNLLELDKVEEDQEDPILRQITENFFDTDEYDDFQAAYSKFRSVDPDDILRQNQNKNTKRKTDSDTRLFFYFLCHRMKKGRQNSYSRHKEQSLL